ncbi:hypothetical protein T03_13343 [Trichinella britovi]|uniref:Uncharacterized protein n=1 Tax=Trichinella britovi TaxID=45882 RepID=A0A0V1DFJ6_TRIBR|nr:hypothetical protein T03_13343 [Trichinella britovi]
MQKQIRKTINTDLVFYFLPFSPVFMRQKQFFFLGKYDWKSSVPSTRTDKFLSIIICKRKEQKWNNRATDAQLIRWYSKEILLLNVEPYYINGANGPQDRCSNCLRYIYIYVGETEAAETLIDRFIYCRPVIVEYLWKANKNIGKPANGDNGLIIHYSKSNITAIHPVIQCMAMAVIQIQRKVEKKPTYIDLNIIIDKQDQGIDEL